jgi:ribosome maturation factor RimP
MDEKTPELVTQLWELLEPVIQAEGMELIEVEYRRESHGWVLRLFIDQPDGVTVDDCARISQVIGDFMDVADLIQNRYHLEVSSPGLNRPLRKLEHFRNYIGKIIELRTSFPLDERRRFKGILTEAEPEGIRLDCQGKMFTIPPHLVERARFCYFDSFEK